MDDLIDVERTVGVLNEILKAEPAVRCRTQAREVGPGQNARDTVVLSHKTVSSTDDAEDLRPA